MLNYQLIPSTGQRFALKGDKPKLLIVSGTHGDEFEVVPLIEEYVGKHYSDLPSFLYVPEVSPSALRLRTRKNADGVDLNRSFVDGTKIEEARQMMELWGRYNFDLFLTFHEDPTQDKFYLYEGVQEKYYSQFSLERQGKLDPLRGGIQALGIELYSGVDDPLDPQLGHQVGDGYVYWPMTFYKDDHSNQYLLLVLKKFYTHTI